jgi:hypothetical protein
MTWEDILKNRRRNIKIPQRPSKKQVKTAFTSPAINLDRVNRQENAKRLEKLRREVDEDREKFPMMKGRLIGYKKTYEQLDNDSKEEFERFYKDDIYFEEYKDLTGKQIYEIEKEKFMEFFDSFMEEHEKKLSEIKSLERRLGE